MFFWYDKILVGESNAAGMGRQMMNKKKFTLEEAPKHIHVRRSGKIDCNSLFSKGFDGDMKLLMSCVENNIYVEIGHIYESIDWSMVLCDYEAMMEEREDTDGKN